MRIIYPLLILCLPLSAASARPYPQQDDVGEAPSSPAAASLEEAQAAAATGDQAEALTRYLRVLATQPDNVPALTGAGHAALAVGDVNAATGFFARAENLAPHDGMVKAGLASAMVQGGDPRSALRFFREAVSLGVPVATIAADRGLAYDLRGDSHRAQADYQLALKANPDDEQTIRRLALSQAIGGDRDAALATLDPLLRRQDLPAWRTRAFVRALTGDVAGAEHDATLVLPADQVETLKPYLERLAALKPGEKAAAVNLGRFPEHGLAAAASPPPRLAVDAAALAGPPAPAPAPGPASPALLADGDAARGAADAHAWSLAQHRGSTSTAALAPTPAPVAAPSPAAAAARARADRIAAAKAAAEAKAEQRARAEATEKARKEKEEKAAERANPARHWVQVAGGANKADLPKAWAKLKAKWPKQLAGRTPWTLHYRFTNRLLIGPFPSSDAAQDWVTERKKEGMESFRVETNAGDPVERVKG